MQQFSERFSSCRTQQEYTLSLIHIFYDNGAKAAMGNFASFTAIPGVEVRTVFFDPVNSLVSGSMTEQEWIDGIKSASDQMRANIIE